MSQREWQRWDRAFKALGLAFSESLARWLGISERFTLDRASSPTMPVKERRPDLLLDLSAGDIKRRVIVECDLRPLPRQELRKRMALIQAAFATTDCEPEQVVLNLTGGQVVEESLDLNVKARVINLACMEAPESIENLPLAALPFVGLMKGLKGDAAIAAVERALREGGAESRLLASAILDFADLGQGEVFVMGVRETIQHKNFLRESLEKERAEGRDEGRLDGCRLTLRDQIARKFPRIKVATIERRLKALDELALRALTLRVLEELSWKEFWDLE